MKFLCKYKTYFLFILFTLIVGFTSGLITSDSMEIFDTIEKSALTPPAYIFPIVWTILYILMGISAAIIYNANSNKQGLALFIFIIQLLVNFFWSIIFFNGQYYLLSFIWLLLLLFLIVIMITLFYRINKKAAYLQIPYLLWVTFAGYLNLMIYLLNK